jgi:hypothetical protein
MMDNYIKKYLVENRECFDRFTFDKIFRFLLTNQYSHEEAKDIILYNCSLSAIIFQERIDNGYYKIIKVNEQMSKDLLILKNEIFNSKTPRHFLN